MMTEIALFSIIVTGIYSLIAIWIYSFHVRMTPESDPPTFFHTVRSVTKRLVVIGSLLILTCCLIVQTSIPMFIVATMLWTAVAILAILFLIATGALLNENCRGHFVKLPEVWFTLKIAKLLEKMMMIITPALLFLGKVIVTTKYSRYDDNRSPWGNYGHESYEQKAKRGKYHSY